MKHLQKQTMTAFLAISLFYSIFTFANDGGGVSGSGNVVRCAELNSSGQKVYKYQLLDYYDAVKPNGYDFTIDLGPDKSYEKKIDYVLNRLSAIDPYRTELYRKLSESFFKESFRNTEGHAATRSTDLGSGYILPKNCKIIRVVIQKSEEEMALSGSIYKYEIVESVWRELDQETIAGLILHEIAYREVFSQGAKSSLQIRRYVGLISSKDITAANYPLEILKSGLMFWGKSVTPENGFDNYKKAALLGRVATNFVKYNDIGNSKSVKLWNLESYIDFKINKDIISCSNFDYSDYSNSTAPYLFDLFSKLTSTGLSIADLERGAVLRFLNCKGSLTIDSKMFKNPNSTFSLTGNIQSFEKAEGFSYNDPIFLLGGNFFQNFYVIKGVIDGVDVSGKLCNYSSKEGINCK